MRILRRRSFLKGSKKEYLENKARVKAFVLDRLEYFNSFYKFKFNRVSVRNQSTRWGSCSRKGNLNFHYKIVLLPEKLADYIIVHELCHLKELNHSKKFWLQVERIIPKYKELRKKLKSPFGL